MNCVCDLPLWYDLTKEEVRKPCEKFEPETNLPFLCAKCEHWKQCHKEEE